MIITHVHIQVKLDVEQQFVEEMKILLQATRAEEGNIRYDLLKSTEQDGHYTMVEVWKDVEATQFHNTSEHFIAFSKKAPTYLAAPMDVEVFSGEAVKA